MYIPDFYMTLTKVKDNPEWCGDLGEPCWLEPDNRELCTECQYLNKHKHNQDGVWTTKNEIEFLEGVGLRDSSPDSFRPPGAIIGDRFLCLTNYLELSKIRSDWGDIDKDKVVEKCKSLLREEFEYVCDSQY